MAGATPPLLKGDFVANGYGVFGDDPTQDMTTLALPPKKKPAGVATLAAATPPLDTKTGGLWKLKTGGVQKPPKPALNTVQGYYDKHLKAVPAMTTEAVTASPSHPATFGGGIPAPETQPPPVGGVTSAPPVPATQPPPPPPPPQPSGFENFMGGVRKVGAGVGDFASRVGEGLSKTLSDPNTRYGVTQFGLDLAARGGKAQQLGQEESALGMVGEAAKTGMAATEQKRATEMGIKKTQADIAREEAQTKVQEALAKSGFQTIQTANGPMLVKTGTPQQMGAAGNLKETKTPGIFTDGKTMFKMGEVGPDGVQQQIPVSTEDVYKMKQSNMPMTTSQKDFIASTPNMTPDTFHTPEGAKAFAKYLETAGFGGKAVKERRDNEAILARLVQEGNLDFNEMGVQQAADVAAYMALNNPGANLGLYKADRATAKLALGELQKRDALVTLFVDRIKIQVESIKKLKAKTGEQYPYLAEKALLNYKSGVEGSGDVRALQMALESTAAEVAKVETNTLGVAELSVEASKQWRQHFERALTAADLDSVLDTAVLLGDNATKAIAQSKERVRGQFRLPPEGGAKGGAGKGAATKPATGGKVYKQTATGPNNHKIGSDDGNIWYDVNTGEAVQ